MNYRSLSVLGMTLVTVVAAGCATGRAYVKGQNAAKAGDWDAAVAYYREALSHDAGRVDVRLALERATRTASQNHMARARQLEQQDQLPGASAEYRQAADLDASNALAAAKVIEIDRLIRQRIEDARPKSQMQELREQARKVSAVPQLSVDPRVPLPALNFNQTAVRDVIAAIAAFAGINVTYDSASQPENNLSKPYTANLTGVTLQDALNQVLGGNMLFYKVVDSKTILIATDNPSNRGRLEGETPGCPGRHPPNERPGEKRQPVIGRGSFAPADVAACFRRLSLKVVGQVIENVARSMSVGSKSVTTSPPRRSAATGARVHASSPRRRRG